MHGQEGEAADCQHDGCAARHLRTTRKAAMLRWPAWWCCWGLPATETGLLLLLGGAECCWGGPLGSSRDQGQQQSRSAAKVTYSQEGVHGGPGHHAGGTRGPGSSHWGACGDTACDLHDDFCCTSRGARSGRCGRAEGLQVTSVVQWDSQSSAMCEITLQRFGV